MANYRSFKRYNASAIIDDEITASEIENLTLTASKIGEVDQTVIANDTISAAEKLAPSLDFSSKTFTYRKITDDDIADDAAIAPDKLAPGAAQSNIGFPVLLEDNNNTMTGKLTTVAGSATQPAIRSSGSTTTGIYFTGSAPQAVVGGTVRAAMNSSGTVTYPSKPAYIAFGQSGWLYASQHGGTGDRECNSRYNWTVGHQKGGSNFSTSTGRFTSPIGGWYFFGTMWYLYNDNNSTSSYVHTFFRKNLAVNITPGSRTPYNINMHGNHNNHDDGANFNTTMYLNAGQFCSLCIRYHSNNSRNHAGHQAFTGTMIG